MPAQIQDKDLSKLKRSELLEIMLAQSEEIDRLRAELADVQAQLQSRRIAIEQSGSIAEASLRLTKVFQEAQRAADLYLENVRAKANDNAGDTSAAPAATPDPDSTTALPRKAQHARTSRANPTILSVPDPSDHPSGQHQHE